MSQLVTIYHVEEDKHAWNGMLDRQVIASIDVSKDFLNSIGDDGGLVVHAKTVLQDVEDSAQTYGVKLRVRNNRAQPTLRDMKELDADNVRIPGEQNYAFSTNLIGIISFMDFEDLGTDPLDLPWHIELTCEGSGWIVYYSRIVASTTVLRRDRA